MTNSKLQESTHDITILGGGLAGLCLAIQIRRAMPSADIIILEKAEPPYPPATHKVGESTVEIASHYFAKHLGLRDYLESEQLRKFGLRIFFTKGDNSTIENRPEFGPRTALPTATYQIDRALFENHLSNHVCEAGIRFLTSTRVTEVEFGDDTPHTVTFQDANNSISRLKTRWIVDCSGRSSILKREMNLNEESTHRINSVWFRVPSAVKIDNWGSDSRWQEDITDRGRRWLSTNHLVGSGYWVWIIPLSSGFTSVGIVADPRLHPLDQINSKNKLLTWFKAYEPQLFQKLGEIDSPFADFKALKHFSHGASKVFSEARWAVSGDSGIFLDPFYSPGSDMVAISNTFITDVIQRDLNNRPFAGRALVYNDTFKELCANVLKLYEDQYSIFGDPLVMSLKISWDFAIYWGYIAFIFYQDRLCDLPSLRTLSEYFHEIYRKNSLLQDLLRSEASRSSDIGSGMIDITRVPLIIGLNEKLENHYSKEEFQAELRDNINRIDALYDGIIAIIANRKEIRSLTDLESKFNSISCPPRTSADCAGLAI